MGFHKGILPGDIHNPSNWHYADATARLAATGFTSGDVGLWAWQLSDNTYWVLTATTPTWVQVGGGSGMSNPMTTNGDLIYRDGGVPARLPIGSNGQTLTVVSGAPTWATPSGGSSIYTRPMLADFTVYHATTSGTHVDTSTGLTVYSRNESGSLTLHMLEDNVAPASTFDVSIGMLVTMSSTNNSGVGLYVRDASGKIVTFGVDDVGATLANVNYWNNHSSYNANPLDLASMDPANFIRVVYDGTNFYTHSGEDLNTTLLVDTRSATAFLGTPVGVGLYQFGYTQELIATFYHYVHTA